MAADPYRYFRIEARELLNQLGQGALQLDKKEEASPQLIAQMLRLAHTLKGAARVVKQKDIAEHAHSIEDSLAPFRESVDALSRTQIDAVLKDLDGIAAHLAALSPQPAGAPDATSLARSSSAAESLQLLRADVDELDGLLDGLTETSVRLGTLRGAFAPLERSRRLAQLLEEQLSSPHAQRLNGSAAKLRSLAVELRTLVEGLERTLGGSAEQMERELGQVREMAERLRLTPASSMFVALERAARDAAQNLGKCVAFATRGGEIRLDAHICSAVQQALVQGIRNAVVHGIETPVQRQTAGKPPEGRVSIEVERRGNQITFVCRDDGQGVNLDAVRGALERQGFLTEDIRSLSGEALLQRLLRGGISTSGAVTAFAGRGIGLDVVREAAQRVGGEVNVRTRVGVGTSLEIVVPASLVAVDALMVEAGGRTVAIPLHAIKQTLRLSKADLASSPDRDAIVLEGQMIPFAPLILALRGEVRDRATAPFWSAVIIESSNALAAVGVERLRGTQTLVSRPLSPFMCADSIVAGAFLDAQGHPQLILDPESLVGTVRRGSLAPAQPPAPQRPILVIDDSLTTRMLEQSILESAGYEVDVAACAEEALEQAKSRRYALFLVDVEMPGMDGFGFIERTRADPSLRDIPAVLVTSRASPEDRQRGASVGARAYIVKSEFDQVELLAKIQTLVGL